MTVASSRSIARTVRQSAWLFPPLLTGALVRFWNLSDQVLVDDENAIVNAVFSESAGTLLRTFGKSDYCQPLAALSRLLFDLGVPLSESLFRAPSLVAGLAAIALLPLATERLAGKSAARVLAWLCALMPSFVIYSRIARSYMPAALLLAMAVLALASGLTDPRRTSWVAAGLLFGSAVWFHLLAAPFVAGCLTSAAFLVCAKPVLRSRERLKGLATTTGIALLVVGLLLWTARSSLSENVAPRIARGANSWSAWEWAGHFLSGSSVTIVSLLFWFAVALGLARLVAVDRPEPVLLLGAGSGLVFALLLVRPHGLDHELVLARYLFLLLPGMVLAAAMGLESLFARIPRPARALVASAAIVGWWLSGPGPAFSFRVSSLAHHRDRLVGLIAIELPERARELELLTTIRSSRQEVLWLVPNLKSKALRRAAAADGGLGKRSVVVSLGHHVVGRPGTAFRNALLYSPEIGNWPRLAWLVVAWEDFPFIRNRESPDPKEVARSRRELRERLERDLGPPSRELERYWLWELPLERPNAALAGAVDSGTGCRLRSRGDRERTLILDGG